MDRASLFFFLALTLPAVTAIWLNTLQESHAASLLPRRSVRRPRMLRHADPSLCRRWGALSTATTQFCIFPYAAESRVFRSWGSQGRQLSKDMLVWPREYGCRQRFCSRSVTDQTLIVLICDTPDVEEPLPNMPLQYRLGHNVSERYLAPHMERGLAGVFLKVAPCEGAKVRSCIAVHTDTSHF